MGEMIQKPDTNPVVVALLNFFLFGALGYYLMGQQKKALVSAIITVVGTAVTCGTLGWVWVLVVTYDAYLLGQKLQRGEAIGENENGLDFLNAVFKD